MPLGSGNLDTQMQAQGLAALLIYPFNRIHNYKLATMAVIIAASAKVDADPLGIAQNHLMNEGVRVVNAIY